MRSSPMPVSMEGRGSGVILPSAERSNCMKTRFQISTKRSPGSCGKLARAGLGTKVVMDFRARAARAGLAHLPEVVLFVQAEDAALRNAGDFLPQPLGVVILAKDGDVELVLGNREFLGEQLPGEGDGFSS